MHPLIRFANRHHAGTQLARALRDFSGRTDVIVLALPRGGVPVARPIADMLQVPLDVWVVRKLGAPGHEELALGALAEGGAQVSNTDLMRTLGVTAQALADVASREQAELQRRVALYRRGAPPPPVRDRTVILVDDGLATGATMEAAIAGSAPVSSRADCGCGPGWCTGHLPSPGDGG